MVLPMVGPEPDQTLPERVGGGEGVVEFGGGLCDEEGSGGRFAGGGFVGPVVAQRGEADFGVGAGVDSRRVDGAQLPEEPAGWVGGEGFAGAAAQTEARHRVYGIGVHGCDYTAKACRGL